MSPSPATLSKALCRPCLVYPLASLDVSGQWPVSRAAASPNEVFVVVFAATQYSPVGATCQDLITQKGPDSTAHRSAGLPQQKRPGKIA